jgi:hypothetical protein
MRKFTTICCILVFVLSLQHKALAQDAPKTQEIAKAPEASAHYYRLDFVVEELGADAKPINSRSYSGTASTDHNDGIVSVRTGSRIPVVSGSSSGATNETNVQYIDVGVNIDAREVREVGDMLAIRLNAEISSLASPAGASEPSTPIIRQTRWQAPVLIPIRKPTTVFTSDDLDSKGAMQLVVTATPLH